MKNNKFRNTRKYKSIVTKMWHRGIGVGAIMNDSREFCKNVNGKIKVKRNLIETLKPGNMDSYTYTLGMIRVKFGYEYEVKVKESKDKFFVRYRRVLPAIFPLFGMNFDPTDFWYDDSVYEYIENEEKE